jgi:hypothetical protein
VEFDAAFGRIQEEGLSYWGDPARTQLGQINNHFGGRGVYFAGQSFDGADHSAVWVRIRPLTAEQNSRLTGDLREHRRADLAFGAGAGD